MGWTKEKERDTCLGLNVTWDRDLHRCVVQYQREISMSSVDWRRDECDRWRGKYE